MLIFPFKNYPTVCRVLENRSPFFINNPEWQRKEPIRALERTNKQKEVKKGAAAPITLTIIASVPMAPGGVVPTPVVSTDRTSTSSRTRHGYSACSPGSSLRMRIASSTRVRKILPSPIFPVRAVLAMVCTTLSTTAEHCRCNARQFPPHCPISERLAALDRTYRPGALVGLCRP